ncbi:hypothetical protein SCATT_25110 [Streptantibioticus cattleyicolor NRRL 8057 = DSM 46488]|uniref:Uncharacterized protein n=1 Tax=Streptantibioticus cattleyicolor (strain ATCC 35852 / DSM 46488 / JCM 4925 / NBRC 14057 / NRRL 8057) TaxID=1003195 RepID=G8WU60_STREN|nr:hypothetical protein SCATT_25110 [Streptantibioticus cattleyicolor NRRL 8057 = DSM 46488]
MSGDREAAVLSLDRLVVVEDYVRADRTPLQPDVILSFHNLCLVRDEGDWFIGHLGDDGSVICWASYGSGLEEAIRGL